MTADSQFPAGRTYVGMISLPVEVCIPWPLAGVGKCCVSLQTCSVIFSGADDHEMPASVDLSSHMSICDCIRLSTLVQP